ncbi:LuxR family two component transcriptional regulator [Roseivirga pacifica]|uniref:DNA-binding response regulator, NarL/FixJ family, contains REC and HTH domains n=1 Tax=Roseivirga pacifica TaxID=1267423 RepID=A0A1I0RNH7_9BACT|nr:response regulator transcription factor [Roseivirga pacifica]MCO6358275.1 response regulator [Roseivirga pacifica]MCO6366261.1 response regulator [Roseivirga pacifica]MCO6369188.1 response regulator [Roseivirga pacifica]MCO6374006.1 response regulator [Roseivirga pacifica]MCO6378382.1 response regulator [Roseivirga pacifica]
MSKKAAIYDPQFLSGEGMRFILQNAELFGEIVRLDTKRQLKEQLEQIKPDFLVLDYANTSFVPHEMLRLVLKQLPKLKVLVATNDREPQQMRALLKSGIKGIVTKNCSEQEISLAIHNINDGGKFFCPSTMDIITQTEINQTLELSHREMQIVQLIGKGLASEAIAQELKLSLHTVNSHRKNILKKLQLKSPTELIIYAVEKGWIDLKNV